MIAALFLAACSAAQLGGNNWPGISAEDDTVYIAYGPAVSAIDVGKQTELWTFEPEEKVGAFLAAPEPSDGKVYFGDYGASQGTFSPGVLASVFALDGSQVNNNAPSTIWKADAIATDRIVGSALVAEGKVFVGTADNSVVALNEQNGNVLWKFDQIGHSVWGQPAFADGIVIVTSLDKKTYALDADSGDLLWTFELGGAIAAGALIEDNVVYVSSFDDKLHALNLQDGSEIWNQDAQDWIWGAPVVEDNHLYFGDTKGNVYALDADSGDVIWQQTVDGAIEGGLVVEDGTVFIPVVLGVSTTDQTGKLIAVSAENGTITWSVDTAMPIYVRPVLAADKLVVLMNQLETNGVGDFAILTIDKETGATGWTYQPSDG